MLIKSTAALVHLFKPYRILANRNRYVRIAAFCRNSPQLRCNIILCHAQYFFNISSTPKALYLAQHIADMFVTLSNSQRLLVCDMIGKLVV